MSQQAISANTSRLISQRQLLGQIGIDCWVSRSAVTTRIKQSDIEQNYHVKQNHVEQSNLEKNILEESITLNHTNNFQQIQVSDQLRQATSSENTPTQHTVPVSINISSQPTLLADSDISEATINQLDSPDNNVSKSDNINQLESIDQLVNTDPIDNHEKIRHFHIQAIHHAHWVLLVDIEVLNQNEACHKLWHNICQAVNGKVDNLTFPLITNHNLLVSTEPMDTVQLANASLAGFIFRIANSEQVKIAGLTTLAKGLYDERMVQLPTLDQMITNPLLKRQLWQALNQLN